MENKNKNNFGLFFIIFLTSFLLGITFSLQIDKIINNSLLKSNNLTSIYYNNSTLNLTKYWSVYDIIKKEYFDSNTIDNNELLEKSIYGLVSGLGDKHSSYLNKEENRIFNESLSGDFEGIGAVVEVHPLGAQIDRIIKGSPAKNYDLRTGDILITANGEPLEGLNLFEAVEKIKGPAGSKVILEVLREGEETILKKEIIREKIKIPSVDVELLDGDISYISLNIFGDDTSMEFKKALESAKNTKGLIIDLRDNGGGYLISAVEILSEFIENGENVVITKYKDEKSNQYYKSINSGEIYNGKIVVLINENSASASEITAGALKDYQKAIIVGKKSYGKGSVQEPFDLGDGSMLKLTVAKWFTPKGINIDEEGILPDIEIDFLEEDYTNKYDRQKEEAKKILNLFIEKNALNLTIDTYKDMK
ncbi:MAG: S41 family peptidase [Candidatus Gracilibacteria bacterium]|nr:S41 family peptidase [Candidatus Gracilibacteria bacterium]